jgi:hypothetical protein
MHKPHKIRATVFVSLLFIVIIGWATKASSDNIQNPGAADGSVLPLIIAHQGSASNLDRPPVAFDHDRHTAALNQGNKQDCSICHILKETDARLWEQQVNVFKFPKEPFDGTDKNSIMQAYHNACAGCHKKMATQNKKTGPEIGFCGKCHVRKADLKKVSWSWQPIFDYVSHAKHVKASPQWKVSGMTHAVARPEIVGEPDQGGCSTCHHSYDENRKKLIYKKDTENSCRTCHKTKDEKNARSMRKVAHSGCIGCHAELRDKAKLTLADTKFAEAEKKDKLYGPVECKGCHEGRKSITPDRTIKTPRLVRGQKDVMDLVQPYQGDRVERPEVFSSINGLVAAGKMKSVPFNHKAHEPRAQFCNTCHHQSVEKCSNCHTPNGDPKKGVGISLERAFHKPDAQQSCVGCHDTVKQSQKCQGCHRTKHEPAPKSSCPICHQGPTNGQPVDAAPASLVFDKEKVPEKLEIKLLEKEFKPAHLPHQKIVAKLTTISNESSLARVFHSRLGEQTLCSGCHHHTDTAAAQSKKIPNCSSCHTRGSDPRQLGTPGIMGAYHQQCIGCHESMKQKPPALECTKCHPRKEDARSASLESMVGKSH